MPTGPSAETGIQIFNRHGLSAYPGIRRASMTTKEVRTVLLDMARPVLLSGRSWDILNKRIGPGIYEVWLREHRYDAKEADGR